MVFHSKKRAMLIKEPQAAEYLGVSIRTLQAWRKRHEGPPYVRFSRRRQSARGVRYLVASLDEWVATRQVLPPASTGQTPRTTPRAADDGCVACGVELPPRRRGRPRTHCEACRPAQRVEALRRAIEGR